MGLLGSGLSEDVEEKAGGAYTAGVVELEQERPGPVAGANGVAFGLNGKPEEANEELGAGEAIDAEHLVVVENTEVVGSEEDHDVTEGTNIVLLEEEVTWQ